MIIKTKIDKTELLSRTVNTVSCTIKMNENDCCGRYVLLGTVVFENGLVLSLRNSRNATRHDSIEDAIEHLVDSNYTVNAIKKAWGV